MAASLLMLVSPALAQDSALPGSSESSWGLRVGLATNPDQVVVGANFLETEIANNVFLEPNAELGFGDDVVMLTGTVPFHYRFVVDAKVRPYAGGGVLLGVARVDRGNEDDTEFEISLRATGGILWSLKGGQEMFAELGLIFGDLHDVQVMVGWRF
jgi:hypothetical protein